MNANDLFKAVTELNLDPIKMKLMHVESGEGWSLEKANAVEKEYRRFLCLMKLFPEEDTAPLVDVDTFWHYHILDTMKYAADCEQVFGYFLHHYPYVGMRGDDDEQFRLESGNRMGELYESIFGEPYPGLSAEAAQEAAFCAGPANDKVNGSALAFCAGPANDKLKARATAFCAGPANDKVNGSALAFCAGPANDKLKARATAFCAGPANDKLKARATAFCAGPANDKLNGRRLDAALPDPVVTN